MAVYESILGILLAIIATACFNYAPILQKEAVDQMETISISKNLGSSLKAMFTNRRWLLGGVVAVAGGIPYTIAMMLIGISVLQPLMSVGFVVLVYFGVKRLGEQLGPKEYGGIALMMGIPVLLYFASVTNIQADMFAPQTTTNLVWFTVFGCAIIGTLLLTEHISNRPGLGEFAWALSTGTFFSLGVTYGQAALGFLQSGGIDLIADIWHLGNLLFQGNSSVGYAFLCLVFCLIFNAIGGFTMQIAFQKGNATRVGPLNQSINVILSVTGGIIIFGQVVGFITLYIIAIFATIFGTGLLGKFQGMAEGQELATADMTEEPLGGASLEPL